MTCARVPNLMALAMRLVRQRLSVCGLPVKGALRVPADRHLARRGRANSARDLRQQRVDVERHRRFAVIESAEQRQRLAHHALHLIELVPDARLQRRVLQRLHLQPQPRERRLQVVRHRRQHARAAVEVAPQSVLHGVEGARRIAQLARAAPRSAAPVGSGGRRCPPRAPGADSGRVMLRATRYSTTTRISTSSMRLTSRLRGSGAPPAMRVRRYTTRIAVGEAHRDVVVQRVALVRGELVRLVERHRHRRSPAAPARESPQLDLVFRTQRGVQLLLERALEIRQQRQAQEAAIRRRRAAVSGAVGGHMQAVRAAPARAVSSLDGLGPLGGAQRLQHQGGLGDAARPFAHAALQHEALAFLRDEEQAHRLREQHRASPRRPAGARTATGARAHRRIG